MTTYVALDMVRSGRATMDQLLTISPEAAAQSPTKMGFPPGTQVTLDNALKMIMVKSANDIAAAIAENLGGSIPGFAGMMNDAAARLGMRESRWANPNGLPDETQQTSARDMAILGRALLREFPDNRELFSISAIKFGRRVMPNHNGLLGRYAGVDGMKTGFTCSSGFNVVASATRAGRRLITVVMGSRKSQERTLKAADLFERGFALADWTIGKSLEDLPPSSVQAPPDLRSYVCGRGPAPKEDNEAVVAGEPGPNGEVQNQLPPTALAFAGVGVKPGLKAQELPPRAALEPMLVWTGRDPAEAKVAAGGDETRPARRARRARVAAKPVRSRTRPRSPRLGRPRPQRPRAAGPSAPQPRRRSTRPRASRRPRSSTTARAGGGMRSSIRPGRWPAPRSASASSPSPRSRPPLRSGPPRSGRPVQPSPRSGPRPRNGPPRSGQLAQEPEERPAASKKRAARAEAPSGKAAAKTRRKTEDYAAGRRRGAARKGKRARKARDDD